MEFNAKERREVKILNSTWRCGTIGIVAVDYPESLPTPYWQAYIGIGKGLSQELDVNWIVEIGDKLTWQEAQVFFPEQDITKYKTYQK